MNVFGSTLISYARIWGPATAVLSLILLLIIVILLLRLRHHRKKHKEIHQENRLNLDRIVLLEALLGMIREMGKISYFIGDSNSRLIFNGNSPGNEFPMLASYLISMLPEDRKGFLENSEKLFRKEISQFTSSYSLLVNGQIRHHLDSARLIRTPHLNQEKFLLSSMDISELEAHNRELADVDSILKAIFDNLPVHIFIKNISSNFEYIRCNPSFSGLLQMNPADMVGKNDFELFDRNLASRIRAVDMGIVSKRTLADNRWFFSTPDGKEHAIRFISRILRRADNSECILGFGVDVTRQELIASKLRRRNKELRLLLSQQTQASMLLDSNLHMQCSTVSLQAFFKQGSNQDTVLTCQDVCDCGITDPALCPAYAALREGREQFCNYAQIGGGCRLKIRPLMSADNVFNYLAVHVLDSGTPPEELPESYNQQSIIV